MRCTSQDTATVRIWRLALTQSVLSRSDKHNLPVIDYPLLVQLQSFLCLSLLFASVVLRVCANVINGRSTLLQYFLPHCRPAPPRLPLVLAPLSCTISMMKALIIILFLLVGSKTCNAFPSSSSRSIRHYDGWDQQQQQQRQTQRWGTDRLSQRRRVEVSSLHYHRCHRLLAAAASRISSTNNNSSSSSSSRSNDISDSDSKNGTASNNAENNNNNNNTTNKMIRLNKVFKATHSRRQADALIASSTTAAGRQGRHRVTVNGLPVPAEGCMVEPFRDKVRLDGQLIMGWEALNGIVSTQNNSAQQRVKIVHQQSTVAAAAADDDDDDDKALVSGNNQSSPTNDQQRRRRQGHATTTTTNNVFEYIKYWKPVGVICTTDRRIKGNILDALEQESRQYRPPYSRIYPVGRLDKDTSGLILLTNDGRLPNALLRNKYKQPKVYNVVVDKKLKPKDIDQLRVCV